MKTKNETSHITTIILKFNAKSFCSTSEICLISGTFLSNEKTVSLMSHQISLAVCPEKNIFLTFL